MPFLVMGTFQCFSATPGHLGNNAITIVSQVAMICAAQKYLFLEELAVDLGYDLNMLDLKYISWSLFRREKLDRFMEQLNRDHDYAAHKEWSEGALREVSKNLYRARDRYSILVFADGLSEFAWEFQCHAPMVVESLDVCHDLYQRFSGPTSLDVIRAEFLLAMVKPDFNPRQGQQLARHLLRALELSQTGDEPERLWWRAACQRMLADYISSNTSDSDTPGLGEMKADELFQQSNLYFEKVGFPTNLPSPGPLHFTSAKWFYPRIEPVIPPKSVI